MRDGAPDEVLSSVAGWRADISSWLDGDLIAESVPLVSGSVSWDRSNQVPERLTMSVARWSTVNGRLFDWLPDSETHPLARYGQRLTVTITVTSSRTGLDYQTQVGVFKIQSWAEDGSGSVSVEASGVLQDAADGRLLAPVSPTGTLGQEFVRLLPATVQGSVSGLLTDRACPETFNWAEDRIGALYEIADAWPARVVTGVDGVVRLVPPLPSVPEPVAVFTDGADGTLISSPRSDTRAGAANVVTAESSGTGDPISATVQKLSGPMSVDGPYGVVTHRFSSAALTTDDQVVAAATAKLADLLRGSRTFNVSAAPDPRVELDDPVELRRVVDGEPVRLAWGWVNSITLPLTVNDGPMTFVVGVA